MLSPRVAILTIPIVLLSGAIGLRLYQLQVRDREQLEMQAIHQSERRIEVRPTRGSILDRNGEVLAISRAVRSFYVHPNKVTDPIEAARKLAPVLERDEGDLRKLFRADRSFSWIDRVVDPDREPRIRSEIPEADREAFGFLPFSRRDYPHGRTGVHVVGVVNVDGDGIEGVEKVRDEDLNGSPDVYQVQRDALGTYLNRVVVREERNPVEIVLTLDLPIQHFVERELDRTMEETSAVAASAVVIDVHTGEILALANRPAADANAFGSASADARINRAVCHQYEPGSTFKFVAMTPALEQGVVRPGQLVDCENGRLRLEDGRPLRDTKPHGLLSASQVIQKSSNIGMVKILRRVAPADLEEAIVRYGFTRKTGIDLPGEVVGQLGDHRQWQRTSYASISFGQEVAVTVLQMANAFATIASGGVRHRPHVVRSDAAPRPGERVVGSRIAQQLTDMMEGVVAKGTGTSALGSGYRLAGKSGTAQKPTPGGYSPDDYVASFGGFGPLPEPRLACLVVIDSPTGDVHYGGQLAAPAFRNIMAHALRRLRVPSDDAPPRLTLPGTRTERFVSMRREPRRRPPMATGDGIPDLVGFPLRQAVRFAADAGCFVQSRGHGRVVAQEPPAGTVVEPGATCRIRGGRL